MRRFNRQEIAYCAASTETAHTVVLLGSFIFTQQLSARRAFDTVRCEPKSDRALLND